MAIIIINTMADMHHDWTPEQLATYRKQFEDRMKSMKNVHMVSSGDTVDEDQVIPVVIKMGSTPQIRFYGSPPPGKNWTEESDDDKK